MKRSKTKCRGHRKDGAPCSCYPQCEQEYCRWHAPKDAAAVADYAGEPQCVGQKSPMPEDYSVPCGDSVPAQPAKDKESRRTQMLVCIVNINARAGASQQLDAELCRVLTHLLRNAPFGVDVRYFTTTDALENAVALASGRIVMFSNFPPDASYGESPVFTQHPAAGGDFIISVEADSYERTKAFFSGLLSAHPAVELHVITGAPFERLTNFEITSVGPNSLITVKRKSEWLGFSDYPQRYADYVIKTLHSSLSRSTAVTSYDRSQLYSRQFSRLSILVLCDQADHFAEDVARQFLEACGQMSFQFSMAKSIEHLHSILMDRDVDGLLVLDVSGRWFQYLDTLALSNTTMAVFYLTGLMHDPSIFPRNVTTHRLEPNVPKYFRELLDSFLASIERLREIPPDVDVRQHVLERYFQILSEGCDESFHRANRYLVRVQHLLLGAMQNGRELLLFSPFESLKEFQTLAHVLPFVSPYSVATYTNALDFDYEEERAGALRVSKEPFSIQMLWDLPRRRYGFLSPASLPGFLHDYSDLFKAGGVQFFPSPLLTQITPENVDELQPTAAEFVQRIGEKPYMMLNKNPSDYFPAASVGAQFACSDTSSPRIMESSLLRRFEIPYISAANPRELAKLLRDEKCSVQAFREHISDVIEDCNRGLGREDTSAILRRFSKELSSGVAMLDDRIRRLKRTNRIGLVAGTVLTATVMISSAFGLIIPETAVAASGTGGGIGVLTHLLNYTNEIQNYRQERLYFLWQLSSRNCADV